MKTFIRLARTLKQANRLTYEHMHFHLTAKVKDKSINQPLIQNLRGQV